MKNITIIDYDVGNLLSLRMSLEHLGAKVTPEVFLLDQEYTIHYNGAIDNWFYSLGKNRNLITSHYLEDAMNSLLNGTKIQIPYVQAICCYIE